MNLIYVSVGMRPLPKIRCIKFPTRGTRQCDIMTTSTQDGPGSNYLLLLLFILYILFILYYLVII